MTQRPKQKKTFTFIQNPKWWCYFNLLTIICKRFQQRRKHAESAQRTLAVILEFTLCLRKPDHQVISAFLRPQHRTLRAFKRAIERVSFSLSIMDQRRSKKAKTQIQWQRGGCVIHMRDTETHNFPFPVSATGCPRFQISAACLYRPRHAFTCTLPLRSVSTWGPESVFFFLKELTVLVRVVSASDRERKWLPCEESVLWNVESKVILSQGQSVCRDCLESGWRERKKHKCPLNNKIVIKEKESDAYRSAPQ